MVIIDLSLSYICNIYAAYLRNRTASQSEELNEFKNVNQPQLEIEDRASWSSILLRQSRTALVFDIHMNYMRVEMYSISISETKMAGARKWQYNLRIRLVESIRSITMCK